MQALAKYFGDKDLTKVRFVRSGKDIRVTKGSVTVPRRAVNSTLGHLYFIGVYNLDAGVEYTFEVPFRLITSAAWGMLVKRTREEGTPEDEIQTPSKGAYVTLRLFGSEQDGYQMKLGKGKRDRKKLERRERRKNRRASP
jgi:hypothetical protein